MKVTKLRDFDKVLRNVLLGTQRSLLCAFVCLSFFFLCLSSDVLANLLACSITQWVKEGQTDPRKTSADCRMTAIVDDEELQKSKASRIPHNTQTNISWAV